MFLYYKISVALSIIILLLDYKYVIRSRPDKVEIIFLLVAISSGFIIPVHYFYSFLEDVFYRIKVKYRRFKTTLLLSKLIDTNYILLANRHATKEEKQELINELRAVAFIFKNELLIHTMDHSIFMLTKVMVAIKILESQYRVR
jgi:hypothetical protein